jgi:penicillin-binding protein 1C
VKYLFSSVLFFSLVVGLLYKSVPSFEEVKFLAVGSDRILYDRNGELLQVVRTDFRKRRLVWTNLKKFSEPLREMVIQSEDQRYYWHFGIDPIGLLRSLFVLVKGGAKQGASTITMQVTDLIKKDVIAGNTVLTKGTIIHKVQQVWRAIGLEIRWSKDQILEAYLNLIHLRGEVQGFSTASHGYLQKPPLAINLNEAVVLVAMISTPNAKVERIQAKACRLLARVSVDIHQQCEELGKLTSLILGQPAKFEVEFNWAPQLAQRLFKEFPGFTELHTNIDIQVQKKVKEILNKNTAMLRTQKVNDSAAIVIENKTGQVIAYVGSVDQSEAIHVDGVRAQRQAGSALKPFLYARAIDDKTITAASILADDPTVLNWAGQTYRPLNYDRQFHGAVSVREALASSLNVPAIKIVTIIGLHDTYKTLLDIGLTNLKQPDFYGVSMALGAVEVRLDELTNAYRTLANNGVHSALGWVNNSKRESLADCCNNEKADKQEPALEPALVVKKSERVFSDGASFIVSSILSDANARAMGFGWASPLETPFWTAVKTGTSKDYRDNWCLGFNSEYTVGVWAGNFNATPMERVSGVAGAGPSWYEIISELQKKRPSVRPPIPETVVEKMIRHSWTTNLTKEYFLKGTEPLTSIIESASLTQIQFIFPVQGSTLVIDPHLDPELIALVVRFKGNPTFGSSIFLNQTLLGAAQSPFRINKPRRGTHVIEIRDVQNRTQSKVQFRIR